MTTEELIVELDQIAEALEVQYETGMAGPIRAAIARLKSADALIVANLQFGWKAHRWHMEKALDDWRSGAAEGGKDG
jgi:hypothetical protein